MAVLSHVPTFSPFTQTLCCGPRYLLVPVGPSPHEPQDSHPYEAYLWVAQLFSSQLFDMVSNLAGATSPKGNHRGSTTDWLSKLEVVYTTRTFGPFTQILWALIVSVSAITT